MPAPTADDRDLIDQVLAKDRADLQPPATLPPSKRWPPNWPATRTPWSRRGRWRPPWRPIDRLAAQHERQGAVRVGLDGWTPARVHTSGPGRAGQLAEQPLEPGPDGRAYLVPGPGGPAS